MNKSVRETLLAVIVLTSIILGHTSGALAQETEKKMSPEETQVMMKQMIPGMLRMMFTFLLEFFADPRAAELEATHARNLYDALQKKGFSKEEALAIVVGYGNPAVRFQSSN